MRVASCRNVREIPTTKTDLLAIFYASGLTWVWSRPTTSCSISNQCINYHQVRRVKSCSLFRIMRRRTFTRASVTMYTISNYAKCVPTSRATRAIYSLFVPTSIRPRFPMLMKRRRRSWQSSRNKSSGRHLGVWTYRDGRRTGMHSRKHNDCQKVFAMNFEYHTWSGCVRCERVWSRLIRKRRWVVTEAKLVLQL